MPSILAAATASLAALAAWPRAASYPALGAYMPVSNVLEHSQISSDVKAFNDALAGDEPNYAGAKQVYEKGAGNSCKSPTDARTLQGFAQKDMAGETFYDTFINAGFAAKWWDDWMLAALGGTGTFSGLSRTKRVTCLKKGAMGLVTLYASHELESAIDKAAKTETLSDSGSAHAWDEGWAFYYGASADGANAPWEVAKKRDGDFPNGTEVQTAIVPHFNKGLIAVRTDTYSASEAEAARDTIYKMWAVTYIRAALKYLQLAEKNYDEKAHAEGYAYFMAIDGWVHSKSSTAAETMRSKLEITQTTIPDGSYCQAKAAMEAAYAAMGLSCSIVGTFTDDSITCSDACTEAAEAFPAGADAVAAVDKTAADMQCVVTDDNSGDNDVSAAITRLGGSAMAIALAALVPAAVAGAA